ncbi:hypothetical protein [Metabacillus idriensis]|uniref:hypothetical protein n=1 Tax=Metabacillus idriensis TaxID=324768 RepID=UPI00174BE96F|nr:hypothetical protein [Metabacillus idriensis]
MYYYSPYSYQRYPEPIMQQLKKSTLSAVLPFVQHGLKEAHFTSYEHALMEVAAMSYLLGKGYDYNAAYQLVEAWEVNESF